MTRQKKRRLSSPVKITAMALLAVAAFLAYRHYVPGQEKVTYQTAEVTRGDIEVSISAAGKITPKESVVVGAQVSGQLQELLVEAGDKVEKGQLLAQIDPTIAMTAVEADRAQLKESQASRKQQQATLNLAMAEAERAEMLYEADAIARADYESAQAAYAIAQGKLEGIDAQIQRQQSTLRADLATLEFTKIYAPTSGTIVSVEADEGQTLNANQTAPTILTIADLSIMTVETDVSEADVLRIKKGQQAYFTTLGDPSRRWETRVRQVLPTPEVLNDVVLYKALLDVDNPEGLLRSEMSAQVFFVSGYARDAVLVPVTALQTAPPRLPHALGDQVAKGRQSQQGGFMQADASEATQAQAERRDAKSREVFRKVAEAHPQTEHGMVMLMTAEGAPRPQPVLVGLKTRTQAEIVYGLEPGQIVITGEVKTGRADSGNDSRRRGPPRRF
ncbi:efflux RND transporter periplasmic adaptor subunit [Hyphomonas pacifica]|nr:efflux RND transporter periplasmic adaptor subunit [Hyphomonas pacifica]